MPSVKEAAVAVVGNIVDIEDATNFETKKVEGVRVLVKALDGFASVKLLAAQAEQIKPVLGMPVAWMIRPGAFGGTGGAKTFTAFVSLVDRLFFDKLGATVNGAKASA